MKRKVCTVISTFLLILSFPLDVKAVTTLYVDPSTTLTSIDDTFSVNITISDVIDLGGWEFKLYYLSSKLNGTDIVEGPFLKQGGLTYFAIINFTDDHNSTHGLAWVTCALLGGSPGVNGSGALATVTFKAKQLGNSSLSLADTFLSDSEPIPHISLNGEVYILPHDLAVTSLALSKIVVGQGFTAKINVSILNQGNFTETFNVIVSANATHIATSLNITLSSGDSTTVTFTWNTTGWSKGNYTISAHASPVPGETNTTDNTLPDGSMTVTVPGDVDGDGDVDIYDVVKICAAYDSKASEPLYNPNSDVNDNQKIDIYDVVIACANYQKEDH